MPEILLQRSSRPEKKWEVELPDGQTIHFGSSSYEDYTQHKDEKRKENYLKRHKKREDWSDWSTAGFWSRWLLWESPSLSKAIQQLRHRFKLHIVYKHGD